jgi:hypothetical protein
LCQHMAVHRVFERVLVSVHKVVQPP